MQVQEILLQPTVLFQIADHRRQKIPTATNKQRVIGCLVGIRQGSRIIINNSFPIPFAENEYACYFDEQYIMKMTNMFMKVYADETLIGYYTTSLQFKQFDKELAQQMHQIVKKDPVLLLNVDCLDQSNYQEPYYQVYQITKEDGEALIQPKNATLHWSLVEKVVIAPPSQKRELIDVVQALSIMERQLQTIKEYIQEAQNIDLNVIDQVQKLLNVKFDESQSLLIQYANDNALKAFLGQITKVCVQIKRNQLGNKIE